MSRQEFAGQIVGQVLAGHRIEIPAERQRCRCPNAPSSTAAPARAFLAGLRLDTRETVPARPDAIGKAVLRGRVGRHRNRSGAKRDIRPMVCRLWMCGPSGWAIVRALAIEGAWFDGGRVGQDVAQLGDFGAQESDVAARSRLGGGADFADSVGDPRCEGCDDHAEQGDAGEHQGQPDCSTFTGSGYSVAIADGGHCR